MKPGATTGIKKKMMDQGLDKHDGEACAGKDTENEDHLCDAVEFPAGPKFLQPLRCGQAMWVKGLN